MTHEAQEVLQATDCRGAAGRRFPQIVTKISTKALPLAAIVVLAMSSCSLPGSNGPQNPKARPGDLDGAFGEKGKVRTAIGTGNDQAHAIAIQSDGRIVVAGETANGDDYPDIAVVRYTAAGRLDTTFGNGGTVTTPIGDAADKAFAIAIQSDGKIVVAGETNSEDTSEDLAIVRYTKTGVPDATFNTSGIVTMDINGNDDVANGVAVQSDGKIVAAGYTDTGAGDDFWVVRIDTNGGLDTDFGGGRGYITTDFGAGDVSNALALQSDGQIVAAGVSNQEFALARYNESDGSLDNTFGTGGTVTTDLPGDQDYIESIAIQKDGKIVAGGFTLIDSHLQFALARYTTGGDLDDGFGTNGIVTTKIGTGNAAANAVALQSDGKIVAAGYAQNGDEYLFTIVRYASDGSVDTGFGKDGIVTVAFGTDNDRAQSAAVQDDGKIVVAGLSSNGSDDDFAVARLQP